MARVAYTRCDRCGYECEDPDEARRFFHLEWFNAYGGVAAGTGSAMSYDFCSKECLRKSVLSWKNLGGV